MKLENSSKGINMSKTRGLILGKFAPFHIGHQRLIEIALNEVNEVYAIIYDCPNLTNIPLNVRANWVRSLYPMVNVIEGWDAPNEHEDTPEVRRKQEEYIKMAMRGKKITHFFSSEYYGDHVSKSLGAIDRRTDRYNPDEGHGITATIIRSDGYLNRGFLNPLVYKDILVKVVFIGLPSEEQDELAKNIAEKLKTVCVEDDFTDFYGKPVKSSPDFHRIARTRYEHANAESKIFSGNERLVYNSTGFIDLLLSIAAHGSVDHSELLFFAHDMRSYDLILVNQPEQNHLGITTNISPFDFQRQIISNLETLKLPYVVLDGTFGQKLRQSERLIKSMQRRFVR